MTLAHESFDKAGGAHDDRRDEIPDLFYSLVLVSSTRQSRLHTQGSRPTTLAVVTASVTACSHRCLSTDEFVITHRRLHLMDVVVEE